ncbi:outer membrane protein assembly factor BamB family protein [Alkalihalobacterium chitinilyticum]|uniref:PQQ-binding-like beta-propeller repeat protein n=1 Tax=Alkalihalobacterium chitinilyticum TaxID=2980103 RepID=A0ABT5VCK6_9BACI|nr:PQQ-binding-like beta-propeller repeat protein [Alkalihalobacterium chitinilyticum]MDE5413182.1 PQQ-binding-like beta-propeller repeat protein [Alkalihalobacterium chitinilyticum]
MKKMIYSSLTVFTIVLSACILFYFLTFEKSEATFTLMDETHRINAHTMKEKENHEKAIDSDIRFRGPIEYPVLIDLPNHDHHNISFNLIGPNQKTTFHTEAMPMTFPETYSEIKGILTFRGNHLRDAPTFGNVSEGLSFLDISWNFQTSSSPNWGGGAGWTGQPVIIEWEDDVKQLMNLSQPFKEREEFVEVIQGSLDGHVYFLDLETGEPTRKPINVRNPIKGSVSVDPRGYPLLYVGHGIPQSGKIGFSIYSLIDGELLHFIPGIDPFAYREWGAFDSSAVVNRMTDTLYVGGENGLFYSLKLHTNFDRQNEKISIHPETIKLRYKVNGNQYQGIENSLAIYRNLAFFADNGGSVLAMDLTKNKPVWALGRSDDTDATIILEIEEDVPYLYTGTEVDKQGHNGKAMLRKINGLSGEIVWQKDYPAFFFDGVNGGLLATPVMGKKDIEDLVIFTVARYKTMSGGVMVALDKQTGKEVWRWEMENYAWSSPVDVYSKSGTSYIVQADSVGNLHLLKGKTGELISTMNVGANIEASPAVFHDTLVVASRGGRIYGIKLK